MVHLRSGRLGFAGCFAVGTILLLQASIPVVAQPDYVWTVPYDPDWLSLIIYNKDPFATILDNMKKIRRSNGENCPVYYSESLSSGARSLHGLIQSILMDIEDFDQWSGPQIDDPSTTENDGDYFDTLELVNEQLYGYFETIQDFERQMVRDTKWLTRLPSSDVPYSDIAKNSWLLACNIVQCEYRDIADRRLPSVPKQAQIYRVEFDERAQAQTVRDLRAIIDNLLNMRKTANDLSDWVKLLNLRSDIATQWPRLFNYDGEARDDKGNLLPGSDLPALVEWIECRLENGLLKNTLEVLASIPSYQETLVESHP
ncbi:hypothetical protein TWF696_003357 [Orbilia brochopaga]|uniref:Uncharacterized protein n=1 Tax=Orbilia brochopaga TaxID=3140254 RepID=A0AAV9TXR0_9PEZI